MRIGVGLIVLLSSLALAQEAPERPEAPVAESEAAAEPVSAEPGVKTLSGMSILGNEETPKSLVIVPWKSSRLGDGLGISNALDDSPRPVDKEVFMRELRFYELRSGAGE